MPSCRRHLAGLFAGAALCLIASGGQAIAGFESIWTATSGLTPDRISIPYTLADSAQPEDPTLGPTFLTLSTSSNPEFQYYFHSGSTLDVSGAFFMEARLRYVSGTTTDASRAPFAITFTTSPGIGNSLYIGKDEVFFNVGNLERGPAATVDTDDLFHTYRIDVSASGALTLSYDGGLLLAAQTFLSVAAHGTEPQIAWGEYSALATGTAEWASFRHNALASDPNAVPEPSSILLCALGAALLGRARLRKGRHPSPTTMG